jgi:hypothetical protein
MGGKPSGGQPSEKDAGRRGKQVNFRASDELFARLERVSDSLGLDLSNFVRMVLMENLPSYEERAAAIRRATADPSEE